MTPTVQPQPTGGAYVTVKATAAILGVHPNTVYRWIQKKKLPASRVGLKWLIAKDAIEAATAPKSA